MTADTWYSNLPYTIDIYSATTLMETRPEFSFPNSTRRLGVGIYMGFRPIAHLQAATTTPKKNPAPQLSFLSLAVSIQSHLKCLQGIQVNQTDVTACGKSAKQDALGHLT